MRFSSRFKRTTFSKYIYVTYFTDLYNVDTTTPTDTSTDITETEIITTETEEVVADTTLTLTPITTVVEEDNTLVLRDSSELNDETETTTVTAPIVNDTTVIHIRGNEDDYRYENSGNTLILTSPDNQYRLANYDVLMFDGLEDNNRPIESAGAVPADYTQGSTSAIFKSCMRRDMLGGDILDREPALICSIIGTGA